MAESDEEVDVEDISDGEQISHLRDMAEEDQKDNWYDKEIGNQNFLNPSSSPFSSDYCDPSSWLLDTNTVWSLDTCTDDKSRATIEKMILEEQMYAYRSAVPMKPEKSSTGTEKQKQSCIGRLPNVKKNIVKSGRGEPSMTHRKPWTADEQELFEQGLGLYGRSWTKIANMIDTRTTLQVKNYAKQYFKHKNKNLMKPEIHATQGMEVQFDETFVVVNHEEIVHENSAAEDEPIIQTTTVSLGGVKRKPEHESDEDVEVDIDGLDHEEQRNNLIPGQTTACPDDVYSALVRAAATKENTSDLGTEEESTFTDSEVNHIDVSTEEKSPSSLQQERSSSIICDSSPQTVNKEEMIDPSCVYREVISLEEFKSGGVENSTVNDTDGSNIINSGDDLRQDCHGILTSELQFSGNSHESNIDAVSDSASSFPTSMGHATDPSYCVTLDMRHVTSAGKSVDEDFNASDISHGSVETSTQAGDSRNSAVEKSWAPVTCGEATCAEFIQPSDRQQPGASAEFIHSSDRQQPGASAEFIQPSDRQQPGASAEFIQPSDRQQPGASAEYQNIPSKEIVIDRNIIQDLEKEHNMEFFMGRALKTPERYMKIRNYILDMWERSKPTYLFKTAVRGGLRNCGDVNSIGRVHAFLEDIGAINEGCFDRPVPRVRQQGEATDPKENVYMESWVNSLRPRKKRPRNKDGDWVDFSKPEGMTIQHLYPEEHVPQDGVPNEKGLPSAPRKRPSRSKPSYDPFLLVPCRKFPSPSAVPFDVLIQSETLVVMDTHAHMSTTEVIGLLGGNYSHVGRLLKVSKAIPCRSLSTGLQCEMDPVSQTQASEDLAHRGLAVVGWYHSHPTFAPIPSVRDIETQAKFQGSSSFGLLI